MRLQFSGAELPCCRVHSSPIRWCIIGHCMTVQCHGSWPTTTVTSPNESLRLAACAASRFANFCQAYIHGSTLGIHDGTLKKVFLFA